MKQEPSAASPHLPMVDAARGAAILAMIVYHFSWDLRYFGYIAADVAGDLGWRIFARSIAGSFLFLVGVGLVLAARGGRSPARYLRRLAIIAGGAAAITAVTWFVFPDSFIFFGILHHIAVASVLALPFVRAPLALVAAAAAFSALAPPLLAGPAFDSPALLWLGLQTYSPRTNDFVPIFPWFAIVLAGIGAAKVALRPPAAIAAVLSRPAPGPLIWAGRNSLAIYLLHQPLLFGLVFIASTVAPSDLRGFEPAFVESCAAACVASDVGADECRGACLCLAGRAQTAGLWNDLMRGTLGEEDSRRYFTLADECRAAVDAPTE